MKYSFLAALFFSLSLPASFAGPSLAADFYSFQENHQWYSFVTKGQDDKPVAFASTDTNDAFLAVRVTKGGYALRLFSADARVDEEGTLLNFEAQADGAPEFNAIAKAHNSGGFLVTEIPGGLGEMFLTYCRTGESLRIKVYADDPADSVIYRFSLRGFKSSFERARKLASSGTQAKGYARKQEILSNEDFF